jgi:hypothetical protein
MRPTVSPQEIILATTGLVISAVDNRRPRIHPCSSFGDVETNQLKLRPLQRFWCAFHIA